MTTLPQPDSRALAISQRVISLLQQKIKAASQPLSFADYMQTVLYEPGLGYYNNGCIKFGADGDFITAPEISPLFSRCLAQPIAQVLATLETSQPVILELGAGNGVMAVELMRALQRQNCLPSAYWILELSADLRARQQQLVCETIPELAKHFVWLDHLPQQTWRGVLVANEVLDAMPVTLFAHLEDSYYERGVSIGSDNSFVWQNKIATESLQASLLSLEVSLPHGYQSEINLWLKPWFKSLAEFFQEGAMLFMDYGFPRQEYYHPQRSEGTLMCHYRHQAHHDPFLYPGLQDITAHVDFTAVAEAAHAAGLDVLHYTNQANFLVNCGIEKFVNKKDEANYFAFAQQIKTLTLPHEMGELFKVIALGKNYQQPLVGFQSHDQLYRL